MTIRAVVFDLGHTLWDIGPHTGALERAYDDLYAALRHDLGRDDLPGARALQKSVYDVLVESSETYFGGAASGIAKLEQPPSYTWLDEGCRRLGLQVDEQLLRELAPPLFNTEFESLICHDGTCEALRALSVDGYPLGCITNTLADEAGIRAMLRKYDVESLMRTVIVSAEMGYRKPHPSLFRAALRDLDVEPVDALFVGDSPWHDVAGAQAVGMRAVLTRQYATRADLDGVMPDAVIAHVRELPSVIARLDRGS